MASKSLGTLTLDLIARVGGFVQGMDKAERQSAKWRKQVEKDAKTVGTAIGAASAAALTGLAAMTASTVKSAGEISRFSAISGAGVEEFQRYAAAADVVGISQEKLSDQLKDFNEKVGEFQQSGGGGMKDFFEQIAPQIGITADAFRDLSGPQALQLYYDSLEKAGLNQQQMSFYLESMASDTTALIPLLKDGGAGFKLLGDEAARAGAILSEDTISAADRLSAAMFVAENAMKGFRNDISSSLLPVLGDLAVELSDVATEGAIAEDVGSVLATTTKGLAAAAVGAFAALQLLGRGIAGVAVVGGKLTETEWYEKIIPPLLYRRIYKNWDEAKGALEVVGDDLDDTTQRYAALLDGIWNAGSGDSGTSENTIERIAKLREEMRKLGASGGIGAGGGLSEEAKKAADAVAQQVTALERAAKVWGMTADEVALYDLAAKGATETQLAQAEASLAVVAGLEKQAAAVKALNDAEEDTNREAVSILDSLLSEEEQIKQSYDRRRQTIMDATLLTEQQKSAAIIALQEEHDERMLELNGSYWERYMAAAEENLMNFDELSGEMLEGLTGRFGDAFESMVFEAETLGEAFSGLAEGMARSVVNAIGEMAAQWLAYQALELAGVTTLTTAKTASAATVAAAQVAAIGTTTAASTAAAATTTATQATAAATTAAAWTPAAIVASIGSFGGAAAIGLAAVLAALAFTGGFRKGGYTGGGGVDDIAGVVHGKEFVFDAESTSRIGVANLEAMRQGKTLDGTIASVASNSTGGGGVANVQIINNGEPMRATSQLDGDTLRIILERVQADIMSDGKTKQAIGQKFGLEGVGR